MRPLVHWFFVALIMAVSVLLVRVDVPRVLDVAVDSDVPVLLPHYVAPLEPVAADVVFVPACDPIEPTPCSPDVGCSPARDGTPRVCARQWHDDSTSDYACLVGSTPVEIRRWRSARLRVLVNEICKPSRGCNPRDLHAYLTTLARREADLRPEVSHRLAGDREANARAWRRLSSRYVDSPAYGEPERWSVGRGYYGQNAAVWLSTWDASAVPEVLCGEVESTLVHLRAARRRWRRLHAGVTCEGVEYRGGSQDDGPTWLDVSRVNSGSDACPPSDDRTRKRDELFVRRSASRGLDALDSVTLADFGMVVDASKQAEFAERVRSKMDERHPRP